MLYKYQKEMLTNKQNLIAGRWFDYRLWVCNIAHHTAWYQNTVMWVWNQWVVEGHTEQHAESQCYTLTSNRGNRYNVKSALKIIGENGDEGDTDEWDIAYYSETEN